MKASSLYYLLVLGYFCSSCFTISCVAGVKEIDIAATLEYLRDQRMDSVQTKEQLEFVLAAVAEEIQALLKALPQ